MRKPKEIKNMRIYFKPTPDLKLGEFWFYTELVDLKGTSAVHPRKVDEERAMRLLREYPNNIFDGEAVPEIKETVEPPVELADATEAIEPEEVTPDTNVNTEVIVEDAPEDVIVLEETVEPPVEKPEEEKPTPEIAPAWTKLAYRAKRDLAKDLGYDGAKGYTNDVIVAYLIENPPKE